MEYFKNKQAYFHKINQSQDTTTNNKIELSDNSEKLLIPLHEKSQDYNKTYEFYFLNFLNFLLFYSNE